MENKAAVTRLAALAQDTRLAIFRLLVTAGPEGMAVGRIGDALGVPPATLSFHLKELAHAQLITARQESRFVFYSANYAAMNELLGFLTENCCSGMPCGVDTALTNCDGQCN
ncbi:helix-turn-helix transcriptional regulator [Chitiniphilus eburneus]|uniref:Helix-turn-helix transcriptional regulator n=1 Tax=Chitiniphilus eburneus TaxID=2571148 RepID=A0A4U0PM78_9NEIS|nr:metalloregulator ArsR/SmtB family transcription factor [Chitiniphilus eburneus]TJZ68392.1 helix-turn-helix transcriptional regulator [Chitiniphilus eburneus]